jgi:peroxiredoxin Q/BCP
MNKLFAVATAAVAALSLSGASAFAALAVGAHAPQFTASGYLDGKPLTFDLKAALKKGPVVLYFFPAPHTDGCNIEAHMFAESIDKFHALGASVIGVTANNLNQLAAFSGETEYCSGKLPMAADPGAKIAKQYNAKAEIPIPVSTRASFVIAPDGKIVFALETMVPREHIQQTLSALTQWRAAHPA